MAPNSVPPSIRLLRLWFAVLGRVAPGRAEEQAARIFLTPRRREPRDPEVAGWPAQRMFVDSNGSRLAGWSWGDGPAVMLVHGWSGRAADMSALATAFVDAGYRAVVFDMPAHGSSSAGRSSLAEWMEALPVMVEKCGGIHAVVAHSLGAAAVVLALEAGLRANGAVLFAPPLEPSTFIERIQRFIGLPAALLPGVKRRLAEHVGRDMTFFDSARAASTLSLPVLIIHDPMDQEVPWSHAEAIARAWSGSVLRSPQDVGHFQILKDPALLSQTVEFVSALTPSTSV
jgi:pimeloyl-ACP methyl ester carboxylesterase